MATIENYVNLPSMADWKEIMTKFPSFASAPLSEKAKKEGASEEYYYNTGYYFTRTALPASFSKVESVREEGFLHWDDSYNDHAGLRVALQVKYDPDSCVMKSCEKVSRTAKVYSYETCRVMETTSVAPVVMFGKKPYIVLNLEECIEQHSKGNLAIAKLVSVESIACAKPFDKTGCSNDYGCEAAKEIRQQCQDEALEFATKEEKKLLVRVRLSKEDGYEKAEPILKTVIKENGRNISK